MKGKNNWALFLMLLAGIVIGGFLGNLFPNSFLNFGQEFGLSSPIILDLGLLVLTFGLTIKITFASILGIVISLIIYRFL